MIYYISRCICYGSKNFGLGSPMLTMLDLLAQMGPDLPEECRRVLEWMWTAQQVIENTCYSTRLLSAILPELFDWITAQLRNVGNRLLSELASYPGRAETLIVSYSLDRFWDPSCEIVTLKVTKFLWIKCCVIVSLLTFCNTVRLL